MFKDPPKLAEGYPDGVHNLFKVVSVSNFVMSDDYLSVLSTAAKLDFDKESDVFARHPLTTEELKEYFQDIKVLGPREIKMVAKWREKMRKFLDEVGSDGEEEKMEEDSEAKEQAAIDAKIESLVKGEASEVKRYKLSVVGAFVCVLILEILTITFNGFMDLDIQWTIMKCVCVCVLCVCVCMCSIAVVYLPGY